MSAALNGMARFAAYLVTFLLAAVWTVGGLETLTHPLLDIGRPQVGDLIISAADLFGLSGTKTMIVAKALAGMKLLVGALLLAGLIDAITKRLRTGDHDDAMLDVSLFVAALASIAAALPGLLYGGEPLQAVVGELMLCLIAGWLAIYSRGYLAREELPRPVRPTHGYGPTWR
jgi:hypothetical protein